MKNLVKLTYKLCSIPSITFDEAAVLSYVSEWLTERGFTVEKLPVGDGRYNIFAYFREQPRYTAIFCTHLDTVAPHIKPSLDDDKGIIYGRGTCDAKGIAVAMIYALLAQYEEGHDDLALLLTVGEEELSDGAKACAAALADRAHYVVVGEPTELRAASAQKGNLIFDLISRGREAHSSQPELGESAIHKLVHDIYRLSHYAWPIDASLGATVVNFGLISGGSMRNVLAGNARAQAIMRTSVANDGIVDEIRRRLSPGVELEILSSQNPFSFFVPEGFRDFVATFGSDAPHLRGVASRMILLGPGSLAHAHKPDERIRYSELEAGMRVYSQIAGGIRERGALDGLSNSSS